MTSQRRLRFLLHQGITNKTSIVQHFDKENMKPLIKEQLSVFPKENFLDCRKEK
jgi:hypothetical protein